MWTFLTGYLLSTFFELGTIELFEEKFSNKGISIGKILIGWLFQEYTKQEFAMTGGKKFLSESDYRNQFLTQILKIVRNFFVYSHLTIFLELGTLLSLFCILFYIIVKAALLKLESQIFFKSILGKEHLVKSYELALNRTFNLIHISWNFNKISLFGSFFFIFKYGFFKTFSLFDIFFITRPVLVVLFSIFSLSSFFTVSYLLCLAIFKRVSRNVAFVFKLCIKKVLFYFFLTGGFLGTIAFTFNNQNLTTENFFKETFFTVLLFLFS